jgi:DNA polymerase III subunit alpha
VDSQGLIWEWLRFGWRYREIGRRPESERGWYAKRIEYEMDLITDKDYIDFFLATSDMVRWAKDSGIPMGPGRGSVAASVVSWLLRITEVDPIRYPHLLFERFIDVTRTDPPDIDLDISDERRHEVREYMASRYGDSCVGTVANFVRYRGKNSLDDVARVYQIPHWAKEEVTKRIIERSGGDSRFSSSIEDTAEMFPSARAMFDQFPKLWQATRLEGNVRGMSIHAAGLIVSNTPLTDVCSVYDRDGRSVLSIDKYDVEYAGMIKMDLLGLKTMGIISNCIEMANLTLEDLYAIPDDDPEALAIFKRGDVTGIFQFEGRATRLVNRDVSPDNFGEVVDINALSRPGPLFSGTTAEYCEVKHGRREPERFHPITDRITAHTRGQIIYQEQILQIVREVGGFDWTNANEIRRIIAKKIGEAAFNVSMGNFVEGASRLHGIDEKTAQRIWKRLVTSGTYAFVYAHSVSYSILGLWCAWLKAHYPLEFYAASLAKEGDAEGQYKLMKDAQNHGIAIRPPNIAISKRSWAPARSESSGLGRLQIGDHNIKGTPMIVAGWEQIKGVGEKTAERIEEYRPAGGWRNWSDLQIIPGIGPKTVERMQEFASARDPFGLNKTKKTLDATRKWIASQRSIPRPTHDGSQTAEIHIDQNYGANAKKSYGKGPRVIYMGMVREINYQDAVENRRSRTGEEAADILKTLKRPDLLAYCSIRCYDTTDEEVYIRVNRFKFPLLKRTIESISINHDVVICVGNRISGFGTPIMAERLYVVDPE